MKKSLVLAMAMALGVTASAYAANPFSDVPAGHWAYDSISKLAAAGVIEGYGDDTFRGDRLMTRYEMAQIVAKAMAKGANVDKLAAEFADELDALGVRVAALEKKVDNVKITGQVRWHYAHNDNSGKEYGNSHGHQLRTRLLFTGKVNDTWNYVTMFENRSNKADYTGDEATATQRAYLDGRLGGAKVKAGRINFTDNTGGNIYDNRADGVTVGYGDKVKLNAYYVKTATNSWSKFNAFDPKAAGNAYKHGGDKGYSWGADVAFALGKKATLFGGYSEYKDKGVGDSKDKIWDAGLAFNFGDFKLDGVYLHGDADWAKNDDGFVITAAYKGANFKKAGTWGLEAKYYDQGDATYVSHTMNGNAGDFLTQEFKDGTKFNYGGFKGYKVAGYYAVAKGMVAGVEYFDLESKEGNKKSKTLWTELQIRF